MDSSSACSAPRGTTNSSRSAAPATALPSAGSTPPAEPRLPALTGFSPPFQPRGQGTADRLGLVLGEEVGAPADAHDLQARTVAAAPVFLCFADHRAGL